MIGSRVLGCPDSYQEILLLKLLLPLKLKLKKHIAILALLLVVTSCKTKPAVLEADASASAKEIIENYNSQNKLDFQTLHIKGSTKYGLLSPNVDLRIKKDEIILISIRVPIAGTIIKAKVTPDYVSYYNDLQSEYFEGDYEFLSDFLGTELDFQKVQNLLLGRTLDDLGREKFVIEVEKNLYKLSSSRKDLKKVYFLESSNFRLVRQFVEQKHQNRSASVQYSNYKIQDNNALPFSVLINSSSEKDKNEFKIEYKSMEFNTEISFPYEIPDGYREIEID